LLYDEPQGSGRPLWLWFFTMIEIPAPIFDDMVEHARQELPNECCGLLLGRCSVVTRLIRLRNELASPMAYSADPRDLFAAERSRRDTGEEVVAIYHSHPTSEARPSRRDLAENYYGDVPRIIVSLAASVPVVKAFRLFGDRFEESVCVRRAC